MKQFGPKLGRTYLTLMNYEYLLFLLVLIGVDFCWPQEYLTTRHLIVDFQKLISKTSKTSRTTMDTLNILDLLDLSDFFWYFLTSNLNITDQTKLSSTFYASRQNNFIHHWPSNLLVLFRVQHFYWSSLTVLFITKFMVTKKDKVSNYLVHLMLIILGSYYTYCSFSLLHYSS